MYYKKKKENTITQKINSKLYQNIKQKIFH